MEDKQKICDLLVPVLQETRDFQELESLKYNKDNETVVATFWYGAVKTANVHMDSGTSMSSNAQRRKSVPASNLY